MADTKLTPNEVLANSDVANIDTATRSRNQNDMVPLEPAASGVINTDSDYTSDDYCEFKSSSERRPTTTRARAKKVRKASHKTQDTKPLLRPAKDILSRIRHDPALKESDFIVGYNDRHAPEIMEMEVAAWKGGGDVTDEEWIPQHRIVYFRKKDEGDAKGERVWDREKRLDRLFGSGVVPEREEENASGDGEGAIEGDSAAKDERELTEKKTGGHVQGSTRLEAEG